MSPLNTTSREPGQNNIIVPSLKKLLTRLDSQQKLKVCFLDHTLEQAILKQRPGTNLVYPLTVKYDPPRPLRQATLNTTTASITASVLRTLGKSQYGSTVYYLTFQKVTDKINYVLPVQTHAADRLKLFSH